MYITLETDYAVRIVSVLCRSKVKMDAKTISEQACVTLRFSLKILRKLLANDIVKSFKGTQGGYIINKEPKDITLLMVVEAIEGTYCFSRCLLPDGVCNRGAAEVCCYRKAFCEVSDFVRDKLSSYNFADLIANSDEFKEDNTTNEKKQGDAEQR
ncbi:MAG: RrF2 family transcriptional regulator [Hominimerdicola sp.]